jgi:hypothetical protein
MMAMMAMAEMATVTAVAMMTPLPLMSTMLMMTTAVIQGCQLDDGNLTRMMGQRQYTSMMRTMTVTAETARVTATVAATAVAMAMAMATAMAMMPPPLLTETMRMKTMAAFRGRRLNNVDWTTTIGRR